MVRGLTTHMLRNLLRNGGSLKLGGTAVAALARGGLSGTHPDVQWLYDCAMERGNSAGTVVFDHHGRKTGVVFSNAGTCSLGIVCDVSFKAGDVPCKAPLFPEDMDGRNPDEVEITYDAFHDGEEGGE